MQTIIGAATATGWRAAESWQVRRGDPNPPAAAGGAEGDRGGDRGLPESHQRRPRRPRPLPPPHPHPPRLADGGVGGDRHVRTGQLEAARTRYTVSSNHRLIRPDGKPAKPETPSSILTIDQKSDGRVISLTATSFVVRKPARLGKSMYRSMREFMNGSFCVSS